MVAISLVNVYGIPSYLDKAASDAVNALLGSTYDNTHRDDILVVVVDANYLAARNLSPPVPFGVHQTAISIIRALEPKSLLIDFIFDKIHENDPTGHLRFNQFLGSLDFPVYLALNSASKTSVDDLIIEAPHSNAFVTVPNFASFSNNNLYCRYFRPGDEFCATYVHENRSIHSAAWAIYQSACQSNSNHGDSNECSSQSLAHPFRLIWGSESSSLLQQLPTQVSCGLRSWAGVLDNHNELWSNRCTYHPTLSLQELICIYQARSASYHYNDDYSGIKNQDAGMRPVADPDLCPPTDDKMIRSKLMDELKSKHIIYGGNFGLKPDVILAPTVKGPIAGAHFHAMALDNLLTFDGMPKSDYATILGVNIAPYLNALFFAFSALISSCIIYSAQFGGFFNSTENHVSEQAVALFFVQSFLSAIYIFWAYYILNLAPSNWIGGFAVSQLLPTISTIWHDRIFVMLSYLNMFWHKLTK